MRKGFCRACVVILAAGLPAARAAAPLFLDPPAAAAVAAAPAAAADPLILRARAVQVNPAAQPSAATATGAVATLNFFADAALDVEWTEFVPRRARDYTWLGRLADDPLSAVNLTVVNEVTLVDVQSPRHGVYQLKYRGDGLHLARQLDPEKLKGSGRCGLPSADRVAALRAALSAAADDAAMLAASTIDVLVVYTEAARTDAGSRSAIVAEAQSAVSSENSTFSRSEVQHRMRLVHTRETTYDGSSSLATDLGWLHNSSTVDDLRDATGADLVSLFTRRDDAGIMGIADMLFSTAGTPGNCHTVCRSDVGSGVWPHEAGHNLGCAHNDELGETGLYSYSFGHHWREGSTEYGTIMSYIGTRVPYFSNPDVSRNGHATGVADERENARTINNSGVDVAGYRTARRLINATPSVSASLSKPAELQTFQLTVTCHNDGPSSAPDVQIKVTKPTGITYLSDDGGGDFSSSTGVWQVPSVANDGNQTLHIQYRANTGTAGQAKTFDVDVTAVGSSYVDFDYYDNSDSVTVTPAAPKPPTVTLTRPLNGAWYPEHGEVAVAATAADADGVVTNLALYADGLPLASFSAASGETTLTNLAIGPHTFFATATDHTGLRGTSAVASIEILAGGLGRLLVWSGGTPVWDVGTSSNWNSNTMAFLVPDDVLFDDTVTGSRTVTLTAAVSPWSMTVISDSNYAFQGTGRLAGSTGLRKSGSGQLTLATTNDFLGEVDVGDGVLRVAATNALGVVDGGTTVTNLGALDLNGQNLGAEPVAVAGAGPDGRGAIVNTGADQIRALRFVRLVGDATFGGAGRWDIRASPDASLGSGGQPLRLTKVGTNQFSLVSVEVDPALGPIDVLAGRFSVENSTSSLGDSNYPVSVASAALFQVYSLTGAVSKPVALDQGATLRNGNGSNHLTGAITLNGPAMVDVAGTALRLSGPIGGPGGLAKLGTLPLILARSNTYAGATTVAGGVLEIPGDAALGTPPGSPTPGHLALTSGTLRVTAGAVLNANRGLALGPASGSGLATVEVVTGTCEYGGVIADQGAGSASLVKTGAGVLKLGGACTYAGDTTLAAGRLQLAGGDHRLPTGTCLRVGSGTVFDLGGTRQTVASLTGTVNNLSVVVSNGELTIAGPDPGAFNSGAGDTRQAYDFSGLSRFAFRGPALRIGSGASGGFGTGDVTLARGFNVLTADTLDLGSYYVGSLEALMVVGGLHLGGSNELNIGSAVVGSGRGIGLIDFQAGLAAPGLRWRGAGGTDASWGDLLVGRQYSGSGADAGRLILTNGVFDARLGTLRIGFQDANPAAATGAVHMGAGRLVASNIVVAETTSGTTAGGSALGTLLLRGGQIDVRNLTLGELGSVNSSTVNGTFDFVSGTVRGGVIRGGAQGTGTATRRFIWRSGTLRNFDGATDLVVSNLVLDLVAGGTHAFDLDAGRFADVRGALTNGGGLVKNGPGTLRLFAANTYSGGTTVSNGTLLVAGALAGSGAVLVARGGTLGGTGTIAGAVTNLGAVAPGASAGTLTVGAFAQAAYGTLRAELGGTAPGGGYDVLRCTGTATLGGTLEVQFVGGYVPTGGEAFAVVSAGSGAATPFAATNLPPLPTGLGWTVAQSATGVLLAVTGSLPAAPYARWTALYKLPEGSETEDPDGDGSRNLIEYAVGSNPTSGLSSAAVGGAMTGGVLRLTFLRNTNATDIRLFAEASDVVPAETGGAWTVVSTWSGAWSGEAAVVESATGTPAAVEVRDPATSAVKRFMRLQVRKP